MCLNLFALNLPALNLPAQVVKMRMDPELVVGIKDGMIFSTPINDDIVNKQVEIDEDLILGMIPIPEDELDQIRKG